MPSSTAFQNMQCSPRESPRHEPTPFSHCADCMIQSNAQGKNAQQIIRGAQHTCNGSGKGAPAAEEGVMYCARPVCTHT